MSPAPGGVGAHWLQVWLFKAAPTCEQSTLQSRQVWRMAVAAELHFCIGPLQEPAGICRALLSPSGQLWCVSSPCLDGKCKNILVVCGDITLTRDFVASTA